MMTLNRLFAAAMVWLIAPITAFADVYLVTDIPVEMTAGSSAEARNLAFDSARIQGAEILVRRLTVEQDRIAAGLIINSEIANRLASAVDVQEEKQSGNYYRGVLSVKFQPAAVDAFLNVFGVPYVDSQDAPALILPNAGVGVNDSDWVKVWADQSSENTLAPYIGGDRNYPSMSRWDAVEKDVTRAGVRRGVMASASASGAGYYVRIKEIASGQPLPRQIGAVGPFATLEQARDSVISYLENDWKARTIVRADGKTQVSAIARFNSRTGWIEIESALKSSRLVETVAVEALSRDGADLQLTFIGRPDQLAAELQASGVNLDVVEEGWLLQSALGR